MRIDGITAIMFVVMILIMFLVPDSWDKKD